MSSSSACTRARLTLFVGICSLAALTVAHPCSSQAPPPTATPVPEEDYSRLSFEELLHVSTARGGRGIFFGAAGEPAADTIRIGVLTPYSRFPEYSQELIDSADLAAHEINAAGGVLGKRVAIIRADDGADRDLAVGAAQALTKTWGVVALIGPTNSTRTLAVAEQVAIPSNVVLITPDATSPAIANLDDHGLVWRTPASDILYAKVAADFSFSKLGASSAGVIYLRNLYGIGLKDEFSRRFEALGGKVVGAVGVSELVDYSTYDLGPVLDDLFAQRPAVVYIITTDIEAAAIVRQVEDGGYMTADYRPHLLGADTIRGEKFLAGHAHSVAEGLYVTSPSTAVAEAFETKFKVAFGLAPQQATGAHAYDSVFLIAYAIATSGSARPVEFAPYLRTVTEGEHAIGVGRFAEALDVLKAGGSIRYTGASGSIHFDEHGDNTAASVEIVKLSNRTFEVVERY